MSDFLEKLLPVGMSTDDWKHGIIAAVAVPSVYSLGFCVKYYMAYMEIFDERVGEYIVGAQMSDFFPIVGGSFFMYFVCALIMLLFVIFNYAYYRRGSNMTYLMRRLPDSFEWHLRAWALPVISAVTVLVSGAVLLIIYYGFYIAATPSEAILPGQWSRYNIFEVLLGNVLRGA